ncbi:MAG TPA: potassium transporter KtrB [Porphyromonadaceae bacterium]|nr:potassium transporter KtrB [Porphyromonadaceae bacterium]
MKFKRFLLRALVHVKPAAFKVSMSKLLTFGCDSSVPERNIALAYLFYILLGFGLLVLPWSHTAATCNWVDDLFTAVSAVSTTGLATVDIPGAYTAFGQCVILLLVQIGSIGYMTISSYLMLHLARRIPERNFKVIRTALPTPDELSVKRLIDNVVHFTLIFELAGFIALWIAFGGSGVKHPAWDALFISISSFGTAGFSTFHDSLCSFRDNLPVNIIVSVLSFAGAMGFIVITDIRNKCTNRRYRVTFTTRVILVMTTAMTVAGTAALTAFPASGQSEGFAARMLEAFFQTMSAMTTVGYNTFDLSTLAPASTLVLTIIMFVGASPSGTGGGVKCTTISAVYAFVMSRLRGDSKVTLRGNSLPANRVDSALASILIYGVALLSGVVLLVVSEDSPMSSLLFEAASALGTVGISLGVTPELSVFGKLVVALLMYIGRIGVLNLGIALSTHALRGAKSKDADIAL